MHEHCRKIFKKYRKRLDSDNQKAFTYSYSFAIYKRIRNGVGCDIPVLCGCRSTNHWLCLVLLPLCKGLSRGFPGGSDGKDSACNAGDLGLILGWEDPLKKEMATHSSVLAWRIPWTEEPSYRLAGYRGGLATVHGVAKVQRVRHDWATNMCTCACARAHTHTHTHTHTGVCHEEVGGSTDISCC